MIKLTEVHWMEENQYSGSKLLFVQLTVLHMLINFCTLFCYSIYCTCHSVNVWMDILTKMLRLVDVVVMHVHYTVAGLNN